MSQRTNQFRYIFDPKSVAVIGASNSFGSWGYGVMSRLVKNSSRQIYPVNNKGTKVMGIKAYKQITDIPGSVDFAVISVPYTQIPNIMTQCVTKQIKAALIISGGFSETDDNGTLFEKEILDIAQKGNISFIGPNSMGHIDTTSGFSTLAWVKNVAKGPIGFISQSGTYGQRIVRNGMEIGLGFSKFISAGNESDLTTEDYLEYLGEDDSTKLIILYIEGLRDGNRFFKIAKKITKTKPIIVLKAGKTKGAAIAAKSHTAAIIGDDQIYDAMFRQAGVIRVDEDDEVFDVVMAMLHLPLPEGKNIGILTDGGGIGVVAADACESEGLELSIFSKKTMNSLNNLLPSRWSHGNPVDMAAPGELVMFDCLRAILTDENVDTVLLIGGIGIDEALYEMANDDDKNKDIVDSLISDLKKQELVNVNDIHKQIHRCKKPLLVSRLFPKTAAINPAIYSKLFELGIPVYRLPKRATKALRHLVWYSQYLKTCSL